MSLSRNRRTRLGKSLSQSFDTRDTDNITTFSQPVASSSTRALVPVSHFDQRLQNSSVDQTISEEEAHLVNTVIRYLLVSDRGKQVINKARIIKNAINNRGKHFPRIMNTVKVYLSEIFGYQLVELEGNKYILVNQVQNQLPHIYPSGTEANHQVLLFLILIHIFMHQESCSEESLWNFLTNLGISCSDNQFHPYFGNVKYLINEVFVAQKYLDKMVLEKSDSAKVEFKWGPRAEHEFSRRTALNFVSQVYNGRAINSWPLQFKALTARERASKSN